MKKSARSVSVKRIRRGAVPVLVVTAIVAIAAITVISRQHLAANKSNSAPTETSRALNNHNM